MSTATVARHKPAANLAQWVELSEARRIIDRGPEVVHRLAREGHVRTWPMPGGRTRYWGPDLARLAPPKIED